MSQVTDQNFGLLIAYLLPGFVGLASLSPYSPVVQSWLSAASDQAPTVGGFLYVTIASVAVGMTISAVRWLVLDFLHHRTGVPEPSWNFSSLQENLAAFEGAVQNHYRFYQFYGNMLVAVVLAFAAQRPSESLLGIDGRLIHVALPAVGVVLFAASRDALKKYYTRASELLDKDSR